MPSQSPLPPADLNGLRRRTRIMNGRCQGFYCGANAQALADEQLRRAGADGVSVDMLQVPGRDRRRGTGGLTAAAALAPRVDGEVVVLEREAADGRHPAAQRSPRLRHP